MLAALGLCDCNGLRNDILWQAQAGEQCLSRCMEVWLHGVVCYSLWVSLSGLWLFG